MEKSHYLEGLNPVLDLVRGDQAQFYSNLEA